MFHSEQKMLQTGDELEQMKALSNVIKQCGTVREIYHNYCFT